MDSTAVVALRFVSGEDAVADGEVTIRPDGSAACGCGIVTEGATADDSSAVVASAPPPALLKQPVMVPPMMVSVLPAAL